MFKGSQNVGDGEHFYQVFSNGGSMNGTTNADLTLYFEALPANQLELALFLEADRMRSLEITQEKLDNQRHAVQEERRLRVDNQPYGRADERFSEVFYDNFAYQHSTIGSMEDLNAASVEDVAAVLQNVLRAEQRSAESRRRLQARTRRCALIRKYFEDIPRQPEPPPVDLSEPAQKAERRETIDGSARARWRRCRSAYKTPPGNTPDQYALQVLSSVLQGGDSSRLYQTLNKEKELVVGRRRLSSMSASAPAACTSARRCGRARKPRMSRPRSTRRSNGCSSSRSRDWELEKAKNTTRFSYLQSIRSAQSRATLLGTLHRQVQRSESHQYAAGRDRRGDARGRAARREAVPAAEEPHRASITTPAPHRRPRRRTREGSSA